MEYRHENINFGPEFDFFEDESDLSSSDTSSKDTTDETSATSDKQVVDGEVGGEEDDSVLYVTFFYCFHSKILIQSISKILKNYYITLFLLTLSIT